jgi:guanylate kinase
MSNRVGGNGMSDLHRNPETPLASGVLFVVTAPSGAGKTSLVQALVKSQPGIALSVSHTTRRQRSGEVDGVHYHFVDESRFRQMLEAQTFLEHARVFGNHYGTSREWVAATLRAGTDVVLEIDWQGARQVHASFPECVRVFILPPSPEALGERLRGRGQDPETVIAERLAAAVEEMHHCADSDYLIINDVFEDALAALRHIVAASRLRTPAQLQRHRALLPALLA